MTIAELHRFAYSRFPKGDVHPLLHDYAAEHFRVRSLTECTDRQIEQIAGWVRSHKPLPRTAQPARQASRSGRRREPGVITMISDRQIGFIRTLASELGWSESILRAFIERELGLVLPAADGTQQLDLRQIGSSKVASKLINLLLAHKRSRAARQRRRTG